MTEAAAAAEEEAADEAVRLANKWDPSEVKRVLDEFASQACRCSAGNAARRRAQPSREQRPRQVILDTGYEEDMFLSNTKICAPPAARSAVQRAVHPSRQSRVR